MVCSEDFTATGLIKVYSLLYTKFSSDVPLHFSNIKHYTLLK